MKKLNKKGFTLVELLAVIIILALLMVVVATTALPAMGKARENSLRVYAQRLQDKAKERYMADIKTGTWIYPVTDLTGETQQYKGYVVVNSDTTGNIVATVYVADVKNHIGISNQSVVTDSTSVESNVTDSQINDIYGAYTTITES